MALYKNSFRDRQMTYLYKQCTLLSDLPITGWYQYRDMFQILPPSDAMKKTPYTMGGSNPFTFQWRSKKTDAVRKNPVSQEYLPDWLLDNELSREGENKSPDMKICLCNRLK